MRGIILKGGQGLLLFGAFGVCILFVCICIGLSLFVCFRRSGQMGDKEGEDLGSLVFVAPLRDPELGCRMCRCLFQLPPSSYSFQLIPSSYIIIFFMLYAGRRERVRSR